MVQCLRGGNLGVPELVRLSICRAHEEATNAMLLPSKDTMVVESGTLGIQEGTCNEDPCDQYRYVAAPEWSTCSETCGGGNKTRGVTCVLAARDDSTEEQIVNDEYCQATKPLSIQPCNTAPCSIPFWWMAGEWSTCSLPCGVGTKRRTVRCIGPDNTFDETGEGCTARMEPPTEQACNTAPCDFCDKQDCSGNGECKNQACECAPGFTGTFCSNPVECSAGLDANGMCCLNGLVGADGYCCEAAANLPPVLDVSGDCCPSGRLDICGVCDGQALVVDALGTCCSGSLDSNNLCCESSIFDECGVCNGDDTSCQTTASIATSVRNDVDLTKLQDRNSTVYVGLVANFSVAMADILGVDSSRVVVTSLDMYGANSVVEPEASVQAVQQTIPAGSDDAITNQTVLVAMGVDDSQLNRKERKGDEAEIFQTGPVDEISVLFFIDPPADGTVEGAITAIDVMESISQHPAYTLEEVGREAVCGNRQCEAGETCGNDSGEQDGCCSEDCPLRITTCPSSDTLGNSSLPCSGLGKCLSGLGGVCECFVGYTGPACGECDEPVYDPDSGLVTQLYYPFSNPSATGAGTICKVHKPTYYPPPLPLAPPPLPPFPSPAWNALPSPPGSPARLVGTARVEALSASQNVALADGSKEMSATLKSTGELLAGGAGALLAVCVVVAVMFCPRQNLLRAQQKHAHPNLNGEQIHSDEQHIAPSHARTKNGLEGKRILPNQQASLEPMDTIEGGRPSPFLNRFRRQSSLERGQ